MFEKGHIVYKQNRKTVEQIYTERKINGNTKLSKRGFNEADEGLVGHDYLAIPQRRVNARLSNNHTNPKEFRSILWAKHDLSFAQHT
jgi:hypothetical protein